MKSDRGYIQESKTRQFIKRAVGLLILTAILFRCITIYLDRPNLTELHWWSWEGIAGVVFASLSVWWMMGDTFRKEYGRGGGFFVLHILLVGIACISTGSVYAAFDNNAAFLIRLSEELMRQGYFGPVGFLYLRFLWGQFWVAGVILVFALWMSNKRSDLYYSGVCHSVGTMGLILTVNYTVSQVDMDYDYFRTINMGVGYGLIVYFTGAALTAIDWLLCRRRAGMDTVRSLKPNNRQFIERTAGILLFLATTVCHLLRYWAELGLDGIEDLNIWWILMEVALVLLSLWLIFHETFSDENSSGLKLYVLHALLGFAFCISVVALYFLHRDHGSLYQLMKAIWGDGSGDRIFQLYLCFWGVTAVLSMYALYAAYRRSSAYFGVVCHGVGTARMIFLTIYLFRQLSWFQEYDRFIQWLVYSILVYVTGIFFAVCYGRLLNS